MCLKSLNGSLNFGFPIVVRDNQQINEEKIQMYHSVCYHFTFEYYTVSLVTDKKLNVQVYLDVAQC